MTDPHATPDRVADLDDALDALEGMVLQYLHWESVPDTHPEYPHLFMSAGEDATDVLSRLRPDRWRDTGAGLEYIGEPGQEWK